MPDYIKFIRSKVGHDEIILNFAGGVVINDRGQILLHQRPDTNLWSLPGGAIELGESAQEAAIREIKEETGLEAKVDALLGVYTKYFSHLANNDKFQSIGITFCCSIIGGELIKKSTESSDVRFFEPDSLPSLAFQQHQDAISDYLAGKRGTYR